MSRRRERGNHNKDLGENPVQQIHHFYMDSLKKKKGWINGIILFQYIELVYE